MKHFLMLLFPAVAATGAPLPAADARAEEPHTSCHHF